jgi:porin
MILKRKLALLCLTVSLCGPAWAAAADEGPAPASTVKTIDTGQDPTPPGGQNPLQAQTPAQQGEGASPGLNAVGRTLQDLGVDVHGLMIEQYMNNVSAGELPGHNSNQLLFIPSIDLDMSKIAGIPGGQVHLAGTFWGLRENVPGETEQIGGVLGGYPASPTMTAHEFSLATYEQKLFNGALDIEAGRTNPSRYFDQPNCLAFFSCFSPTVTVDADLGTPPYAVWGGRVKVNMGHTYVQAGAFEDNTEAEVSTESVDFSFKGAVGTLVMAETGYRSDFSFDKYPRNFAIGMFYDTAGYGTTHGTPFPWSPSSGRYPYNGGKGIYLSARQTVWTGPRPATGIPSNIAVYGHLSTAVSQPQPIDLDVYGGVVAQGLLPNRPYDTVGFKAEYLRLDPREAAFETEARLESGGPYSAQSPNEALFQINGYWRLTSWAGIQPDVSYFVNPDSYYNPFSAHKPQDGFIIGAQLLISLGPLFGTSAKPF